MRRFILVAAVLSSGCVPVGCQSSGPPAPDSCSPGTSDGVATLLIGPGSDGSFVRYVDGQPAQFVIGGQGLTMLPIRLFVAGPNPPACLQQSTIVCGGATCSGVATIASNDVPLKTYPDGTGRSTKPLYIVLDGVDDSNATLAVQSSVGSVVTTVRLGPPAFDFSVPLPSDMSGD